MRTQPDTIALILKPSRCEPAASTAAVSVSSKGVYEGQRSSRCWNFLEHGVGGDAVRVSLEVAPQIPEITAITNAQEREIPKEPNLLGSAMIYHDRVHFLQAADDYTYKGYCPTFFFPRC